MNSAAGSAMVPSKGRCAIPSVSRPQLRTTTNTRIGTYRRNEGFWTGFAIGGALFGAAGFFFAPQISRAILTEQQKLRVPRWMEEDEKPPVTKADLEEKIAKLHAAINDVATQVNPDTNNSASKEIAKV